MRNLGESGGASDRSILEHGVVFFAGITIVSSFAYLGVACHIKGGTDEFYASYGLTISEAVLMSMLLPESVAAFLELAYVFYCYSGCCPRQATGSLCLSCPFALLGCATACRFAALLIPGVMLVQSMSATTATAADNALSCVDIVMALVGLTLDLLLVRRAFIYDDA